MNASEYTNGKFEEVRKALAEALKDLPSRSALDELRNYHDKLRESQLELSASVATLKQQNGGENAQSADLFYVRDRRSGKPWQEEDKVEIPTTPVREQGLSQSPHGIELHPGSDSESSWTEPDIEESSPFRIEDKLVATGNGNRVDVSTNDMGDRVEQDLVGPRSDVVSEQATKEILVRSERR